MIIPKVSPTGSQGLQYQQTSADPSMFGGNINLQPLANTLQDTSKLALQVAVNEQQIHDEAAAKDLENQATKEFTDLLYHPETGYYTKAGKNALDAFGPTNEQLEKIRQDYIDRAQNGNQRRYLENVLNSQYKQFYTGVNSHASTQRRVYATETGQANIVNQRNAGALAWNDDNQLKTRTLAIDAEVQKLGQLNGWDESKIIAQSNIEVSKMFVDAVGLIIAQKQPLLADEFVNKYGDMIVPEHRAQVFETVDRFSTDARAETIADRLLEGSLSSIPAGDVPSANVPGIGRTPEQRKVANLAIGHFTSAGFTDAGTAGIVSNLGHESDFNPKAVGDGGTSIGLAQHHDGEDVKRKTELAQFAKDHGYKGIDDPVAQLRFIIHELETKFPKLNRFLKTTNDEVAAAMEFQKVFENPKIIDPQRGETAKNYLRLMRSGNPNTETDVRKRLPEAQLQADTLLAEDPQLRDAVAGKLNRKTGLILAGQEAQQREALNKVMEAVIPVIRVNETEYKTNPNPPTSLADLPADVKPYLQRLDPQQMMYVNNLLQTNANGIGAKNVQWTPEAHALSQQLRGMSVTDPEQFSKLQFHLYADRLPSSEIQSLIQISTALATKEGKALAKQSTLDKVISENKALISSTGIPLSVTQSTDPQLVEVYQQFIGKVDIAIEDWERNNPGKPRATEDNRRIVQAAIADPELSRAVTGFQIRRASETNLDIERVYRDNSKLLQDAGIPLTVSASTKPVLAEKREAFNTRLTEELQAWNKQNPGRIMSPLESERVLKQLLAEVEVPKTFFGFSVPFTSSTKQVFAVPEDKRAVADYDIPPAFEKSAREWFARNKLPYNEEEAYKLYLKYTQEGGK